MVHKYLLVGLTPLVSIVPTSGNFVNELGHFDAGEVIRPVLDVLEDDGRNFCLFFDFDKTIIKKNLPDIVRDKQIKEGLFGFGLNDVKDVFGFQSVPTSLNCILENEHFSKKVQEIYDFFVTHHSKLNSPHAELSHEEQEELKGLIKAWDTLVFQVINYKGEENNKRCSYLLLTKDYRLLYGLSETIRNKLIADAFSLGEPEPVSKEGLRERQRKFAYPKMLEFINVLRKKHAKTFIITATHYSYLDPALEALGIKQEFTGVYGTSPTDDEFTNVLQGYGRSMSAMGKADQVKIIEGAYECTALFAVGDSIYDYQMLDIVLKKGGYGLVISTDGGDNRKLENIRTLYPNNVAIQLVNDKDWISRSNS